MVTPQTAFTLLQSGGIDIFPAGATLSFLRDTRLGLDFASVYYYDGQGFMVRRESGVKNVIELENATICITQGTTLEQNTADYFGTRQIKYDPVTFTSVEKAMEAYYTDRCDAITMQRAALAAEELGISQANVTEIRENSENPEVQRLLGVYGNFGKTLGLGDDWAYNIIHLVGNYQDIWQRNLTPVGLERGPNALWADGGVMIALPFR